MPPNLVVMSQTDIPHRSRMMRWTTTLFASVMFFALLGPLIGILVFLPKLGPVASLMTAHIGGFVPALLAGALNAVVILSGIIRSRTLAGRLLHALLGSICGGVATILYFDYGDWVLLHRTTDWYDFWYTFNRSYLEFAVAGLIAGGVCAYIFNPWAQRRCATLQDTGAGPE